MIFCFISILAELMSFKVRQYCSFLTNQYSFLHFKMCLNKVDSLDYFRLLLELCLFESRSIIKMIKDRGQGWGRGLKQDRYEINSFWRLLCQQPTSELVSHKMKHAWLVKTKNLFRSIIPPREKITQAVQRLIFFLMTPTQDFVLGDWNS